MARPAPNFNDLKRMMKELMYKRDLFGIFLFNEGPSQRFVRDFAKEWFPFLDDLARSSDMYLFIPISKEQDKEFKNFSLEVGRLFDIRPNQLPGILLFSLLERPTYNLFFPDEDSAYEGKYYKSDKEGIYLPLETELFENNINEIEAVFNDLFSVIHKCQRISFNHNLLLHNLSSEVESLKRKQELRPAVSYIKGAIISVVATTGIILGEITKKTLLQKGMSLFIPGN